MARGRGPARPPAAGAGPVAALRAPGQGFAVRAGLLPPRPRSSGFCDADMATTCRPWIRRSSLLTAGHPVVIGSRALATRSPSQRSSAGPPAVGADPCSRLGPPIVPDSTDTQCGFKFFSGPLPGQRPVRCGRPVSPSTSSCWRLPAHGRDADRDPGPLGATWRVPLPVQLHSASRSETSARSGSAAEGLRPAGTAARGTAVRGTAARGAAVRGAEHDMSTSTSTVSVPAWCRTDLAAAHRHRQLARSVHPQAGGAERYPGRWPAP